MGRPAAEGLRRRFERPLEPIEQLVDVMQVVALGPNLELKRDSSSGSVARTGRALIARASAMPSISGMFMSSRTSSKGGSSVAASSSSSARMPPFTAVADIPPALHLSGEDLPIGVVVVHRHYS